MNEASHHVADLAGFQDVPKKGTLSRTLYSDDRVKAIWFGFAAGEELSEHTASMPAILHFLQGEARLTLGDEEREDFREKYALARARQADAFFDQAVMIADNAQGDWVTDEHGQRVFNHEHVQRSRLRVDTRKWAAARLSPRKYGDKLLHTDEAGVGPARIIIEIAGYAQPMALAPGSPPSPEVDHTAPLAVEVVPGKADD